MGVSVALLSEIVDWQIVDWRAYCLTNGCALRALRLSGARPPALALQTKAPPREIFSTRRGCDESY